MADQKLVEMLKRSVEQFNDYRDSKGADLSYSNFRGANLRLANLEAGDKEFERAAKGFGISSQVKDIFR